ncbi:hypothetical protein [Halohasta litorea]|uniref:Uncharacterized protein n=1 Tax=Halohasta litorea TaxID=869891 RepID=A0ABD6D7H8_9EURY|nr:hypothetical protein [Halohasta litorea]
MKIVRQILFREPDGGRKGLFNSGLSFICLLTWVYTGVILDSSHLFLFIGLAFGLSGIAESLPSSRRRSAGALRTLAVSILVVYLGLLTSAPELVFE